MWIKCSCGNRIHDNTDNIPYKARYISDQDWFDVLDKIDASIESAERNKEKLCMDSSNYIYEKSKEIYQCYECGRLYVDDNNRKLHEFIPAEDMKGKVILSSK